MSGCLKVWKMTLFRPPGIKDVHLLTACFGLAVQVATDNGALVHWKAAALRLPYSD